MNISFFKKKFLAAAALVCLSLGLLTVAGCGQEEKETSIYADIDIQDYGVISVKLDPEAAPATVENFVKLAEEGFYDGLTFHRIMDGFMM